LGRDYVPPKPQAGLFDTLDPGDNDEDESDPGYRLVAPHNGSEAGVMATHEKNAAAIWTQEAWT
jgi:hypothetical protein